MRCPLPEPLPGPFRALTADWNRQTIYCAVPHKILAFHKNKWTTTATAGEPVGLAVNEQTVTAVGVDGSLEEYATETDGTLRLARVTRGLGKPVAVCSLALP